MLKSIITLSCITAISIASDEVPLKSAKSPKQSAVRVVVAEPSSDSAPKVIKQIEYVTPKSNNKSSGKQITPKLPLKKVSSKKKPGEKDGREEVDHNGQEPREKLFDKLRDLIGYDDYPELLDLIGNKLYRDMDEAVLMATIDTQDE